MKLITYNEASFDKAALWFSTAVRIILNVLLFIAICALAVGIIKSGVDLFHNLRDPLESILQSILLDVVFILALTELIITILGYLRDGRVHVRYIVDTVLIIMLNELVSMWFKHPSLENAISLSIIVGVLALVRISVTKFAPNHTS